MKIAFMGTPDFAVDSLHSLAISDNEVVGVFCQPDKPVGRKHEIKMPPVKVEAQKHSLPVFQPDTLRGGAGTDILKTIKPDLVVVAAYGKILPTDFLSYPKYGCINLHASILPKYRGASPIHWAVINGESETGVTVMQMDDGLDTGDILYVKKIPIGQNDTTEQMYEKLAPLAAQALTEILPDIESGRLNPIKQDESKATKVGLLSKQLSRIDWNDTAQAIHNKIRGLYSWPGASTTLDGKTLKIHQSSLTSICGGNIPGQIQIIDGRLLVCCGDNRLIELKSVQLEGKKRMDAAAFLNGTRINNETILV